jgi:SAM-dependent methyltransferase
LDLNRQFYQSFGPAFAATRRRIQPGVRRVLATVTPGSRWLDLGCGSGALAAEWARTIDSGLYLGQDFSESLLEEARRTAAKAHLQDSLQVRFERADLADLGWVQAVAGQAPFDGVLAFAVLHHLPGWALRERVLKQVRSLLAAGGRFIHSEWQFQNSPRLLARVLPWEQVDLENWQVEPGDTLLDWRYTLPGQPEQTGLRYVHLFTQAELKELAEAAGFSVEDEFESDGEGGRLGLYQVWRAV